MCRPRRGTAYHSITVRTVSEFAAAIAERTGAENSPDWDPIGQQLGDPRAEVTEVAVCHEVNTAVLEALDQNPVDVLVTYHPLLFTPSSRLLSDRSVGSRAYRLIESNTALVVTHTDFDAAPGGMADALADYFGLSEVEPFGADPVAELAPIGRVGRISTTVSALVDQLIADYGQSGMRISGSMDAGVESLAVVPGSGGGLIEAAASRADALVTGDVSHHRAVAAADLGMAVIDPGHTVTERPGMAALVRMVAEMAPGPVLDLTGTDPKVWR